MTDMRELITVEQFSRGFACACGAWLLACLLVGLVGHRRGKAGPLARSLAWAALGPIALALWQYYSWTVRVVPETGYVGLHKVRVFALNLLVFVALGTLLGWLLGRWHHPRQAEGPGAGAR